MQRYGLNPDSPGMLALRAQHGDPNAVAALATPTPVVTTANDYVDPQPDTLYQDHHNGYLYRTDSNGLLVETSGQLVLQTAPRNGYRQAQVGHSSNATPADEGGHMIGTQFNGLGAGCLHMVPQSRALNRGAGSQWTAMERQMANALSRGDSVHLTVEIDWGGSLIRPVEFTATWVIVDHQTGVSVTHTRTYQN
jgi:hypothetical protein